MLYIVTFRKPQKTSGATIKPISDSEKHHISPRNAAFRTLKKPVSDHNKARFARRSGLYFYTVLLKTLYANGLCKPSKTRVFAAGSTVGRKYRRIFELRRIFIHFSVTHSVYLYTSCSVLPYTRISMQAQPLRPYLGSQFTARYVHRKLTPSPPPVCTYARATSF